MPLEKQAGQKNKGEEQNPCDGKNAYNPALPASINLEIMLHLALTEMRVQIQKQCSLAIVCPPDPSVLSASTANALKCWATPPKASQKGFFVALTNLVPPQLELRPHSPTSFSPPAMIRKNTMKPKAGPNFAEYL